MTCLLPSPEELRFLRFLPALVFIIPLGPSLAREGFAYRKDVKDTCQGKKGKTFDKMVCNNNNNYYCNYMHVPTN